VRWCIRCRNTSGRVADLGFVDSAGIAALGRIVGVVIGLRVAMTLVLLAEEFLRWDEEPPVSRIGRLYLRLDGFIDRAGL
jgi:hypothetical protein